MCESCSVSRAIITMYNLVAFGRSSPVLHDTTSTSTSEGWNHGIISTGLL